MPRQGDGSSNNGPFDTSRNIGHGVTSEDKSKDKTAPLPEGLHEKGAGIEGMNASGGRRVESDPKIDQGERGSSK